jgi:WXXGXW repeat (2 copies)
MNQSSRARTEDDVIEEAKAGEVRTGPAEREWWRAGLARLGRGLLGAGLGIALVLSIPGCHKSAQAAGSQSAVDQDAGDPADANMAQADAGQPAQALGQSSQGVNQQQGEEYAQQQPAPIVRQAPDSGQQSYDNGAAANGGDNGQVDDQQAADDYANDLTDAQASDPPPPLPEYDQPPAPDPDYLWTPGYWAWGPEGYYWVPGCWVEAPYEGALWTPGYWGFFGGFYRFHHGYWGLHIGFYGGVDYGYGYIGHGYYGGYWNGGHFFYNTTITRVNVTVIRNVYVHPVRINNVVITGRIGNRVSFNGGRGGVVARPLAAEVRVLQEKRIPPMASQVQAQHEAAGNRQQLFTQNKGRPAAVVAARPIAKDRVLPAAVPRPVAPVAQPGVRGNTRPGAVQEPSQGARPQAQGGPPMRNAPAAAPESRPVPVQQNRDEPQSQLRQAQPQQAQPQPQTRQAAPQSQVRQAQPQMREAQPQQAAPQPQIRQAQPQPEVRQAQPQMREAQPQQAAPQPQIRQAQPQPEVRQAQPQMREAQPQQAAPQPQIRQAQPQPEVRPAAPQPQQRQAQPQPEARPAQPQPQAAPRPQPQARPAPEARPQPKDEKPR